MNQIKFFLAVALVSAGLFSVSPAQAVTSRVGAADDLGLGIALGQPMGATAKYWLSPSIAVDG